MSAKKPRAALYARYSTDRQRKESAEDQFRMCRRVAEREGFQVVATYSDPGISGGTAQRPQYQAMREAARRMEFDFIIAEDLKRLWREQSEQWAAIKQWLDLGINVVTASGIDSRQKGFDLIASVQGAAAEMERTEAGYRTRRGLEGRALANKSTGGKAYGYDSGPSGRTINRAEAKIVVRIFKMRRDGMSPKAIARKLNAEGIPSPGASWNRSDSGKHRKPTDKGWRSNAIGGDPAKGTGILNNATYAGQLIWGRTRWERGRQDSKIRKVTYLPPEQWIRQERPDLRIVPADLWEAVQQIQTRRDPTRDAIRLGKRRAAAGGRGRGPGYWLSSIIVCGKCGANYIGYGPYSYICATAVNGGKCSNDLYFRRDDAHEAMFGLLRDAVLTPDAIERERKRCEAILQEREREERMAASQGTDTAAIDAQIAQLKQMRGKLSPAVLAAALAEAERERAKLLKVASGKTAAHTEQAKRIVASLPEFAARYRAQVDKALIRLADPAAVAQAREATRGLVQGGRVLLAPTAPRDAVTGPVELLGLGAGVLRLAGAAPGRGAVKAPRAGKRAPFNKCGSGGVHTIHMPTRLIKRSRA